MAVRWISCTQNQLFVIHLIPYSFFVSLGPSRHKIFAFDNDNDDAQSTAAHSRTLPPRQYATTVPVLALWVSGEAYYYASYVSIQLDNPNDNRNQRQHQRHLPFLLLQLTALPFRFGLTLATPPLHHPHLHSSILPLLLHPTSTPTTPKSQTKRKAQSNIHFSSFSACDNDSSVQDTEVLLE